MRQYNGHESIQPIPLLQCLMNDRHSHYHQNSAEFIYAKINFNPLNAELNPICHLLSLLGAHPIFHVSGLRIKFHHVVFLWLISLYSKIQKRTELFFCNTFLSDKWKSCSIIIFVNNNEEHFSSPKLVWPFQHKW
jgi:hypothetical protein